MYTRNKVNLTITTILLVSALIIMLAPFYFIVVNSFCIVSIQKGQEQF